MDADRLRWRSLWAEISERPEQAAHLLLGQVHRQALEDEGSGFPGPQARRHELNGAPLAQEERPTVGRVDRLCFSALPGRHSENAYYNTAARVAVGEVPRHAARILLGPADLRPGDGDLGIFQAHRRPLGIYRAVDRG